MTAVKENAYAKINLFLDVESKRDDGFHEIKTVMHTVSLADEITVRYTPSDKKSIRLRVSGVNYLPTDSRNLAVCAASAYMDASCMTGTVDIFLRKEIPIAAGLAGGSTDAAAVLRAMNKINKRTFTEKHMLKLSASLGSDVPFCYLGGTALCRGRGDDMIRLNSDIRSHFVIAIGNEHVSTPAAYGALDERFSDFDGSIPTGSETLFEACMKGFEEGKVAKDGVFNVFESVILPICPVANTIKAELMSLGADFSLMSGSGPSVFGAFSDGDKAREVAEKLKEKGYVAFYAHSV